MFNWKKELQKLNFVNRAIMQILNIRMIYLLLFVAFIGFVYPRELLTSDIGIAFLAGNSLFWLGRTIEQFIFFKVNNKYVHVLTAIFILGTVLFALPLLLRQ